nr:MAG TPA: hypothetical protein [Caudoviricetes sp.]
MLQCRHSERTKGSDTTKNEKLTVTRWDTPKHHRVL